MTHPTSRALAASALVYTGAIALMGREVLASLATAIAADIGDPVLNAAILAWNARTVPWTDAWFDFPAFYPARNALTFSEHLLGVSPIFTPLYWVLGDAIAAYNLTLLASYVLTGVATFALVLRLTRSHAAAFVAGTAFAFAPYRASHLSHVQVSVVCWAPLALLGLHAYLESGRRRWLVLFGASWLLQGAANGYFLVFFSVLVGFWILWFVIVPGRWRDLAMIAATLFVSVLPLAPILVRFVSAHAHYGLSRPAEEIAGFSAELGAVACASEFLTIWGWLTDGCRPEGALFPGVVVLLLCLAGAAAAFISSRRRTVEPPGLPRPAAVLLASAAVLLLAGFVFRDGAPEVTARASTMEKPLTRALLMVALAAGWWFLIPRVLRGGAAYVGRVRQAGAVILAALGLLFASAAAAVTMVGPWQWAVPTQALVGFVSTLGLVTTVAGVALYCTRLPQGSPSVIAFYAMAAVATWMLAWGPAPLVGGEPILPQGPYAWLMLMPGMDGLRVPARFWMMTALCLSVLAGFAAATVMRRVPRPMARSLVPLVAAGLLLDGWTSIPAAPIVPPPPDPAALQGQTVLTLPLGSNIEIDLAAQYAAVIGGWRSVNGFSGYEPAHYERLRRESAAADPAMLAPFLARGDLHVVVADNWNALTAMVENHPGSTRVAETSRWRQFRIAQQGRLAPHEPRGRRHTVRSVRASCSEDLLPLVLDGDPETRWHCGPQEPTQALTADLGAPATVGTVVPGLGIFFNDYPRALLIETSTDGESWQPAWDGPVAAEAREAEFYAPRENRLVLTFTPREARFVRLRLTGSDEVWYWSIAELEIWTGDQDAEGGAGR